ncbi:MAG: glycosyltransferase family 39 protein [Victivallaceae bacterium]|nr:glycosyltransferase family 39 protein [Victivallaceae bacterium]
MILSKKSGISICLAAVIVLGAGLRLARALETTYLQRDEVLYLTLAEKWEKTDFRTAYGNEYIPPMLLFLMKFFRPLFGSFLLAGRTVNILSGVFFITVMFYLTLILFGNRRCALTAALLAAVHPYAIRLSASCLREGWGLALVAAGTAFMLSAIQNSSVRLRAGAGALIGLAALFRYESLEFVFIVGIFELLPALKDRRELLPGLKALALFSVSAVLTFVLSLFIIGVPVVYYGQNLFKHAISRLILL